MDFVKDFWIPIAVVAGATLLSFLATSILGRLKARRANRLTPKEEELLMLAARTTGEIRLLEADQTGKVVSVSGVTFDSGDRERARAYGDALERLVGRSLVAREGEAEVLFVLTTDGWQKGKRLARVSAARG